MVWFNFKRSCGGRGVVAVVHKKTKLLAALKKKYVYITTPTIADTSACPDVLDQSWEMLRHIHTLSVDNLITSIDAEASAGNNIVISLLSTELPSL